MKHPDYVSPRTLRRRKGRAIRKARRESRQRFAVIARGIGLATGAFAAVAAGIGALGAAALIATTRLRALEDASAMAASTYVHCGDCGSWPTHAPWCLRLRDHTSGSAS